MDTLSRYLRTLMVLSLAITGVALIGDRGGGRWFFTLLGFTIAINLAPYLLSLAAMRRLPRRWGLALGTAACLFGVADVAVRMQAFNFPTPRSDAGMAFWLPVFSVVAIPLLAGASYLVLAAAARLRPDGGERIMRT
jgi:hypothetical protein